MRGTIKRLCAFLFALLIVPLIAACAPTPTPTPRPAPTNTPQIYATVLVTAAPRTVEPTWTRPPTTTPRPTATRLPTNTPPAPTAPAPTQTPAGGKLGVVTDDGFLTVVIRPEDMNAGLKIQARTRFFGTSINFSPTVEIQARRVRMAINFNNFTESGLPGNFTLSMRAVDGGIVVDLLSFETASSGAIPPEQVELTRELVRLAMVEQIIPTVVNNAVPGAANIRPTSVAIHEGAIWLTVRIDPPPPTPGA